MDKEYIEKRQKELEEEFNKGKEALKKLQIEANRISETMKQIQGAYAELVNQKEVLNGTKKENEQKNSQAKKAKK